jgi:uncharacterized protein (TIRG00374 family)
MLAIGIALLQIAFSALRWREITGECGAPLTTAQVLRFNLIGSFFNQTLPSSIGGDTVRILLVRRTGTRWRAAAYSVFIDRAIGLIALAIIVVGTLPGALNSLATSTGATLCFSSTSPRSRAALDFSLLAGSPGHG